MTQIRPEYLFCYSSRSFDIHNNGEELIVTNSKGMEIERVGELWNKTIMRDVFNALLERFIFDYDNELKP